MPELPVTIDDVRRAAAVIEGHVHRTPVFSCSSLGQGVWLKAELLQVLVENKQRLVKPDK